MCGDSSRKFPESVGDWLADESCREFPSASLHGWAPSGRGINCDQPWTTAGCDTVTTGTVGSGWGFRTISNPPGFPSGRLNITGWMGLAADDTVGQLIGSAPGLRMTCISWSWVFVEERRPAVLPCGRVVTAELGPKMLDVDAGGLVVTEGDASLFRGNVEDDDSKWLTSDWTASSTLLQQTATI